MFFRGEKMRNRYRILGSIISKRYVSLYIHHLLFFAVFRVNDRRLLYDTVQLRKSSLYQIHKSNPCINRS